MAGTVEKKLADLGIKLPTPAAPIANYVPFVVTGNLVFVLLTGSSLLVSMALKRLTGSQSRLLVGT